MSSEYTLIKEPDVLFELVERSSELTLQASNDCVVLPSRPMSAAKMLAALTMGIQGCLYNSNISKAEFIKTYVDQLYFQN